MSVKYLHVGGLVAMGFDSTGRYLLTVSHSGRGVFDCESWSRVARDGAAAYPTNGVAVGIGPINGLSMPVAEIDYETGTLTIASPDGKFDLTYDIGMIAVSPTQQ